MRASPCARICKPQRGAWNFSLDRGWQRSPRPAVGVQLQAACGRAGSGGTEQLVGRGSMSGAVVTDQSALCGQLNHCKLGGEKKCGHVQGPAWRRCAAGAAARRVMHPRRGSCDGCTPSCALHLPSRLLPAAPAGPTSLPEQRRFCCRGVGWRGPPPPCSGLPAPRGPSVLA